VLAAAISQRVAFAESAAAGQTVLETEPQGHAAQEIRALVAELSELFNDQQDSCHQSKPAKQAAAAKR
jgi:cellulose biosynthesis protein BcsQ